MTGDGWREVVPLPSPPLVSPVGGWRGEDARTEKHSGLTYSEYLFFNILSMVFCCKELLDNTGRPIALAQCL